MKKKPEQAMNDRKEFIKTFEELSRRHDRFTVFGDFAQMTAISLSQAGLRAAGFPIDQADETLYMDTVARYEKEEIRTYMPKLFGLTITGLDVDGGDWLGSIYGELGLCNENSGQFFTPYDVSKLIGELYCGDKQNLAKEIEEKKYIMVNEPAAGSGGMILAFADSLRKAGYNPARHMFVVADELSHVTANMCYIQLSLHGIPGVVRRMNTLSQQKYWARTTPVYYLENWHLRLRNTGVTTAPEGKPVAASGKTKQRTNVKKESIRK